MALTIFKPGSFGLVKVPPHHHQIKGSDILTLVGVTAIGVGLWRLATAGGSGGYSLARGPGHTSSGVGGEFLGTGGSFGTLPAAAPLPIPALRAGLPAMGAPALAPSQVGCQRVVVSSGLDTLEDLSLRYYGLQELRKRIYDANRTVIEAAAQAAGRRDSDHGRYLPAGLTLCIP